MAFQAQPAAAFPMIKSHFPLAVFKAAFAVGDFMLLTHYSPSSSPHSIHDFGIQIRTSDKSLSTSSGLAI